MAASYDVSKKFPSNKSKFSRYAIFLICLLVVQHCHCGDLYSENANDNANMELDDAETEIDAAFVETSEPDIYPDKSNDDEMLNQNYIHRSPPKDFYSFSVKNSDGKMVSLGKYRGKVTLVVNVASECGFTDSHYRSLIRLKNILAQSGQFEVLAFPCNQFGAQEPGPIEDIQRFVRDIYHVNFPLFDKINVLDDNVPEAWQYLIASHGTAPNWNFWKYLVNENGHVLNAWGPRTSVEDIFHEVKDAVQNVGFNDQASPQHDRNKASARHGGEL